MQKSVLITGCSSGIGLDAARALRAQGWRVFASCRKPEDCARLAAEGFDAPRIDYADPASIEQGLAEVLAATEGRLDALVNNGAFAIPGYSEDLTRDALRAIFETNLFGWHDLTRRVIPVMRAQGDGRIVNISSVLGFTAMPWRGAYVATKFALEGLTDTLRMELHGAGIEVVLIEPGPITSRFRDNALTQFERWVAPVASAHAADYARLRKRYQAGTGPDRFELPPSAVSAKLIHALENRRPRPRYYVTTPTHLMGAARRLLPTRALDRILRRG
ncbi:SDR family NAD(P)-dependent oxidoreductase [Poseidonocella sedimentorum]|uniref:Short-chain dehydrogenase n=1 Tax=Poseidonocella sedimentorum TaxID=871652 RepID=A0A1I6E9N3_9RHOB|nr:SDR family NAD(P)-dependent oxidoreductase [Poseidonocella sedimentorum]SFR14439.1 Short-chain dehydrogenase [Poseidonocella sedimentorum]